MKVMMRVEMRVEMSVRVRVGEGLPNRLLQFPTTCPEVGRPFPLNQYKGTTSTSKIVRAD